MENKPILDTKEAKAISKYLSYVLRHDPEDAGIILDSNGWTDVDSLIEGTGYRFAGFNKEQLQYVVATNSKQRFSFNEDKTKIRASQGHSVNVELNYMPQQPPIVLFHGTSKDRVEAIMKEGLKKQERHHVHLSQNVTTALQVGGRHGHAFILKIHSRKMHEDGYVFYLSANEVWLTDYVPPAYIEDEF